MQIAEILRMWFFKVNNQDVFNTNSEKMIKFVGLESPWDLYIRGESSTKVAYLEERSDYKQLHKEI